jgi:hypothetical protein
VYAPFSASCFDATYCGLNLVPWMKYSWLQKAASVSSGACSRTMLSGLRGVDGVQRHTGAKRGCFARSTFSSKRLLSPTLRSRAQHRSTAGPVTQTPWEDDDPGAEQPGFFEDTSGHETDVVDYVVSSCRLILVCFTVSCFQHRCDH